MGQNLDQENSFLEREVPQALMAPILGRSTSWTSDEPVTLNQPPSFSCVADIDAQIHAQIQSEFLSRDGGTVNKIWTAVIAVKILVG